MKAIQLSIICLLAMFIFSNNIYADHGWKLQTGYRYTMAIIGTITIDGVKNNLTDKNKVYIAAFGEDGKCRSISKIGDKALNLSSDEFYMDIASNTNGEKITFKVYDDLYNIFYNINNDLIFLDGGKKDYFSLKFNAQKMFNN